MAHGCLQIRAAIWVFALHAAHFVSSTCPEHCLAEFLSWYTVCVV
jgi:hypothetical protein